MLSLWKNSLCCTLLTMALHSIQESRSYAICSALSQWLGGQLRGSLLFHLLTEQRQNEPCNNLSSSLRTDLRGLQARLWSVLRLDRLLRGSLFRQVWLWCALPLILAPLLPTMVVLALVMGGFASLFLTLGCQAELRPQYSPMNKWVLLYACIYGFCTLASVSFTGSLFVGMISICFILFYFVVITALRSWSSVVRLIYALVLTAVPVTLYAFWQYLHPSAYRSVWVDTDMFTSISFRVYSTLANPNVLGTYLLMLIPFVGAIFLTTPGLLKKLCAVAVGLMLGLCLVLIYSRGCYLGILFAAAVFLVLLDRRFLLLGLVLLLFSPLYLPETIITRFTSIGDMADSSTSYRVFIWLGTLRMLKDYWFCGIGPGETAFNLVYPLYSYTSITAPHSHNLFLQVACDTGIMGVGIFMGLLVSFFRGLFTALKKTASHSVRIFQIAAISAMTGFLVESMTDYTFYNYRVTLLFWAMLALGVLLCRGDSLLRADLKGQEPWADSDPSTRKIRVLNIISDSNIGGAGRTLLNFLKYHDRSRYCVTTLVPTGSALKPELEKLGGHVIQADIQGDRSLDLAAIPTLRAMVAAAEPDVVHTHGSMSGRIAARGSHAALVYSRHSAFPVSPRLQRGPGHLANRLLNHLYADGIIAVSPATQQNLTESGVSAGQITVVMNGVDALSPVSEEALQSRRAELKLRPTDFVVGILARLEEYKGHLILLEATAALRQRGYPIQVLIAGVGDYQGEICRRRDELGLQDCVQLLGFTTQVSEFLSCLQVQVNCSFGTEATSLSLLEGFSLGVPAVVSSYGGNPWLVSHGDNGLIFENKNPRELADCLARLMEDRAALHSMGERARQIYQQSFTGQSFAQNIQTVYDQILKR